MSNSAKVLQAELISSGAELLSGRTLNRHGQVLGAMLKSHGVELVRDTTLPDDVEAMAVAVREACGRVPYLFISGGLGPTVDDVTRKAVATALGREIVRDEESYNLLKGRCEAVGREFTASRQIMADIVEGAHALQNAVGFAPGEWISHEGTDIFLLPGPPRELLAIMEQHVLPWLRENLPEAKVPEERILIVAGKGESDLAETLEQNDLPEAGVSVAYYSGPGQVELVFRAMQNIEGLERCINKAVKLFGDDVVADHRCAVEFLLAQRMDLLGQTLAVAESCTGGLLGGRFTAVPGSSSFFKGGVLTYSDEVKADLLGVPKDLLSKKGAVSAEVAASMARKVKETLGSDVGISITGIAGPGGGSDAKPVGLVYFGLAQGETCKVAKRQFSGDRGLVRERAVQYAMDLLRRNLG